MVGSLTTLRTSGAPVLHPPLHIPVSTAIHRRRTEGAAGGTRVRTRRSLCTECYDLKPGTWGQGQHVRLPVHTECYDLSARDAKILNRLVTAAQRKSP